MDRKTGGATVAVDQAFRYQVVNPMTDTRAVAVVFNTDPRWFSFFRPRDELVLVDEVNFWRPIAQDTFRALHPGEPLFFRLKAPAAAIAGFGFFALEHRLPIDTAWLVFGRKNGDPTEDRFQARIHEYRQRIGRDHEALSCLVLRDAVFLPSSDWMDWRMSEGWSPRVQSYKNYDLHSGAGEKLRQLLRRRHPDPVPDFDDGFTVLAMDPQDSPTSLVAQRIGQGTFRVRLFKAYGGQCAVTGEHALPVLDAAHIQPYLGPGSNHIQNGLLLRTDVHRLYDAGYVTVTPEFRVEVSNRLRDEFDNGKVYYEMAGRRISVPADWRDRPSTAALEWHAANVFR